MRMMKMMLTKRTMMMSTSRMIMMLTKRMVIMLTIQEEHTVWVSLGSLPTLPSNWTITEAR